MVGGGSFGSCSGCGANDLPGGTGEYEETMPWKHQETCDFLMLSIFIEKDIDPK